MKLYVVTVFLQKLSGINKHLTQYSHFFMSVLHIFHPGGIAGAASRITGAMAKGVAAITMDEEYQQKRREAMNKQPSGLKEGLTRGGKGLVSVRTKCCVIRFIIYIGPKKLTVYNNICNFFSGIC